MTTKLIIGIFTIIFLNYITSIRSLQKVEDSLELVHVLFRHGDRTSDQNKIYPLDPHKNESYLPYGPGQLTNAGKRKSYYLGKILRKRYGKFLGKYSINTLDTLSTNYNRTKMSLQLVLASLFPPEGDLLWEQGLNWQPIPINYRELANDHILGEPIKNCPSFIGKKTKYLNSGIKKSFFLENNETISYILNNTGYNEIRIEQFLDLYFLLTTEMEFNLSLPTWTKSVYPDAIKKLGIKQYKTSTATTELKKLSSGFLLKKIIDDTKLKMNNMLLKERKIYLYSGHDYNVAFLLRLLGTFYDHVPKYGSCIMIEIHNINGTRGVKVFYEGYETKKPIQLRLPNCELICPFNEFINLYEPYLPKDANECFN